MQEIYISKDGQEHGPYSLVDLDQLLQNETITGDDLYWYDGADDWALISDFPGYVAPSSGHSEKIVHVIATIALQPGQRSAFLEEFHALMPLVRAEAGCIEYGSAVDVPTNISAQAGVESDTVFVIEKWADVPSLEAHLVAPHMGDYRKRVQGLVKSVSLRVLEPSQ